MPRYLILLLFLLLLPACSSTSEQATEEPAPPEVRKVVLLQGIDTSAACDDGPENDNSFPARSQRILRELAEFGVMPADVIGFSYTGLYADCPDAAVVALPDLPYTLVSPVYEPSDTCGGSAQAAARLRDLLDTYTAVEPGVRFDIVAHSFGGIVASSLVADAGPDFVRDHVRSLILLDSPVAGAPVSSPASVCPLDDQSWLDMRPDSEVIGRIASIACDNPDLPVYTVLATPQIGDGLECARSVQTSTYAQAMNLAAAAPGSETTPSCANLQPLATTLCEAINQVGRLHSAVWLDPVTIATIVQVFRGEEAP